MYSSRYIEKSITFSSLLESMRVWYFRLKARLILLTMIGSFQIFHSRNTYCFHFSQCMDCRDAVDSVSWINFHGQKQVNWGKVHLNGSIHVSEIFTDSKGPQQHIPSIRGTNFSCAKNMKQRMLRYFGKRVECARQCKFEPTSSAPHHVSTNALVSG